jgi:hypothetical protein
MKLNLIPLQSTSTHVDSDEYMRIQTRPKRVLYLLDLLILTCIIFLQILDNINPRGLGHGHSPTIPISLMSVWILCSSQLAPIN